jgi:hypothetical protein
MAGYATTLAPFVVLRVEYLSILSGWLACARLDSQPLSLFLSRRRCAPSPSLVLSQQLLWQQMGPIFYFLRPHDTQKRGKYFALLWCVGDGTEPRQKERLRSHFTLSLGCTAGRCIFSHYFQNVRAIF